MCLEDKKEVCEDMERGRGDGPFKGKEKFLAPVFSVEETSGGLRKSLCFSGVGHREVRGY